MTPRLASLASELIDASFCGTELKTTCSGGNVMVLAFVHRGAMHNATVGR